MSTQPNPLINHFRSPKLYLKLPSGANFYTKDVVEMPQSGELPVFPMTAKDEILMKNPDALLNGEATTQLIKSCIPNVREPLEMISPDVEAMLVAITGASNNGEIPMSAECPDCKEVCEVTFSAEAILETMESISKEYKFNVGEDLVVQIRPFTYRSTVKAGLASFQSTRSLQGIADLPDDMDKLKLFNDNFMKIAATNFELLVDSVRNITIKNAEEDIVVTDRGQILEFLENCDYNVGKQIDEMTGTMNNLGVSKDATFECEKCEKTFNANVGFDPVNFFTAS